MLISIGRRAETPPGLLDLLVSCHGRIRQFIEIARVIGAGAVAESSEIADGCERVARYFGVAFPLHIRDEEDSLLPRLRGTDQAVDLALEQMAREHQSHEAGIRGLLNACAELGQTPEDLALRGTLGRIASGLSSELEEHLLMEEATIFPAVTRVLSPATQEEIVRELRQRRAN